MLFCNTTDLVVEMMITSRSCPWNSSTLPIFTIGNPILEIKIFAFSLLLQGIN